MQGHIVWKLCFWMKKKCRQWKIESLYNNDLSFDQYVAVCYWISHHGGNCSNMVMWYKWTVFFSLFFLAISLLQTLNWLITGLWAVCSSMCACVCKLCQASSLMEPSGRVLWRPASAWLLHRTWEEVQVWRQSSGSHFRNPHKKATLHFILCC